MGQTSPRSRRLRYFALLTGGALLTAGCALVAADAQAPSDPGSPGATVQGSDGTPTITTNLAPPSVPNVDWRPVGTQVGGKSAAFLGEADDGQVALLWLNPDLLKFRFVPGYDSPGEGPRTTEDKDSATWVPDMIAAFNGGFLLKDGAGGYYYNGETVRDLEDGYGSVKVARDGHLTVGSYGRDIKVDADTAAIRQNLKPLIDNGTSQASEDDSPRRWGIADGNASHAKRSAVGQLADGAIVFAYGNNVTAANLADAMVAAGVKQAVALDMNLTWPTGYYYTREDGQVVGHRIHPEIMREPSTYLDSFKKDFFVADSKLPLPNSGATASSTTGASDAGSSAGASSPSGSSSP